MCNSWCLKILFCKLHQLQQEEKAVKEAICKLMAEDVEADRVEITESQKQGFCYPQRDYTF